MGDSTAMTIEFLRARLLSERSVSRTARQRADELAKRVSELEEQLRVVSLQRMKAEKATEAVLAILEGNGISDVSETYDSSSDQNPPHESKQDTFVNSKVRNESEEFSGSDIDFSPILGKSLSWNGCKETSHSLERYKQSSFRRRSTSASVASFSKNQPGKSCRKIRYKESRSIAEELKANPVKADSLDVEFDKKLENSTTVCSKPGLLESNSGSGEEKMLGNDQIDKYNGYGGDRDMEEALEHQAQLIGQFEAMEKAQRDWEEKFRENNNSTPDSCDPGNRSDVTEETYEIKASVESPAIICDTQTHDARSKVSKITGSSPISSSQNNVAYSDERQGSGGAVLESSSRDFAFPMANGMQNEQSIPSNSNGSFRKEETSICHNGSNSIVPHRRSQGLGGVLDALKDARKSLQQRIDKLPFATTDIGKQIQPLDRARISSDEIQIPVGCVGLFRLPTDLSSEGNFPNSNAQLSLGAQSVAIGQLDSSPYMENWSIMSSEDKMLRNGSRILNKKPYFDPYLDTGLPSSSKYSYPNYPINTTYPDMMPRMGGPEVSSSNFGTVSQSQLSFLDDKIRRSTYR